MHVRQEMTAQAKVFTSSMLRMPLSACNTNASKTLENEQQNFVSIENAPHSMSIQVKESAGVCSCMEQCMEQTSCSCGSESVIRDRGSRYNFSISSMGAPSVFSHQDFVFLYSFTILYVEAIRPSRLRQVCLYGTLFYTGGPF